MLGRVLKDLLRGGSRPRESVPATAERQRVLNVGGGSKRIPIPGHYAGWEHLLLDIDPRGNPDVLCDARDLQSLPAEQFDAVYCSHNLEHYLRHDALKVLLGFRHVLKAGGFAEIHVPDVRAVMNAVTARDLDLPDTLYQSASGPISVLDVLYGLGSEIERTGNDYYAHKTGFTPSFLRDTLGLSGFAEVFVASDPEAFEIRAFAFKTAPTDAQRRRLMPDS